VARVGWAIAHPDFGRKEGSTRQPQLQHNYLPTWPYLRKTQNFKYVINLWPDFLVKMVFTKNPSRSAGAAPSAASWQMLNSDDELRFMYENGQGHLTLFCIVFD
jgi:hypothetical protein